MGLFMTLILLGLLLNVINKYYKVLLNLIPLLNNKGITKQYYYINNFGTIRYN
jgi:hypothetical protein